MELHVFPVLAFGFGPMEIAAIAGIAILLFGADKLPKLARSAGLAKKEFMVGQAEADIAAEKAREEARKRAEEQAVVAHAAQQDGAPPAPTTTSTI
jgi:sec-independent protein translocase protein TatA